MDVKVTLCKSIGQLFPLPVHPFNLQNQQVKSYAQWQYEKGEETIHHYLENISKEDMLKDKMILDIGCGAGGKSLYYASNKAKKVYGLDIVKGYEHEACRLAVEKKLVDRFEFVLGDAAQLVFKDKFFDVIMMNDAMEHVQKPLKVLQECYRVLKPGGKLYINYPPYYHPYGAHLSDVISFPWIHVIFDDDTLIKVYKYFVQNFSDGEERIALRISKDHRGKEYFSYINKMTVNRFVTLLAQTGFQHVYHKEVPLRKFLKPLAYVPYLREGFIKTVVCILEKAV